MLRSGLPLALLLMTPMMVVGQDGPRASEIQIASDPADSLQVPAHILPHGDALTLADLEGIAVRHNPTLGTAAARLHVARGKRIQAGLYPNPVVGYHGVEMGLRGTSGQQGGFVSQQFITGGKLNLDRAIAGKEIDEAHYKFHAQEQRVLTDVRVRFYEALVAQRRVQLTGKLVSIGDKLVRATEKLIEVRQGTENDLLQAEIKADESHILLDNSENQHTESWRRLAVVVGVPSMQPVPLDGQLDEDLASFDWDTCCASVLGSNPTLNAARTRVDRARIVIQRAGKDPIPNVDVWVSHRHHNVTDENVTNVQVGIPLPIFNRNQGNIRSAEAAWVAACHDFKRIELELQDRLAVVYRRYANARQQTDRYGTRMVPRAQRSLTLVTEGYETGQVKYLTLLTAQQTFLQVSLSYLDSLRELRTASSIIEGRLLTDSLAERIQATGPLP